ncbi:MAG: hypothetical protein NT105_15555, partial [Verrucomicrobia bacterium]|nr:hypothetical protein [Verrucomicrobiota bacterium]
SEPDLTLSEPNLTLSEAGKVAAGRPKGLFLSKNRIFDVPRRFLPASRPVGATQWLFLDSQTTTGV